MGSKNQSRTTGSETVLTFLSGWVGRREQQLEALFTRYGYSYARLAFGFVFILFGAQKPFVPGASPVGYDVTLFATRLGLGALPGPITWIPLLIGCYEMTLGTLILFDKIRPALPAFFAHQLVTLIAPFVVWDTAFREPYLHLGTVTVPYAFDWFAAYALKNVLFIAAFCFLFTEYRRRRVNGDQNGTNRDG